jgi:hypothetical protein
MVNGPDPTRAGHDGGDGREPGDAFFDCYRDAIRGDDLDVDEAREVADDPEVAMLLDAFSGPKVVAEYRSKHTASTTASVEVEAAEVDEVGQVASVLAGKVSPVSYTLPPNLTYDEWAEIGGTLRRIHTAVMWWWGEWWWHGEHHYGDAAYQAAPTGYKSDTLAKAAKVCRRIPEEERDERLTFGHYIALARLQESGHRVRIRDEAIAGDWTVRDTESAVTRANALERGEEPDVAKAKRASSPGADDGHRDHDHHDDDHHDDDHDDGHEQLALPEGEATGWVADVVSRLQRVSDDWAQLTLAQYEDLLGGLSNEDLAALADLTTELTAGVRWVLGCTYARRLRPLPCDTCGRPHSKGRAGDACQKKKGCSGRLRPYRDMDPVGTTTPPEGGEVASIPSRSLPSEEERRRFAANRPTEEPSGCSHLRPHPPSAHTSGGLLR